MADFYTRIVVGDTLWKVYGVDWESYNIRLAINNPDPFPVDITPFIYELPINLDHAGHPEDDRFLVATVAPEVDADTRELGGEGTYGHSSIPHLNATWEAEGPPTSADTINEDIGPTDTLVGLAADMVLDGPIVGATAGTWMWIYTAGDNAEPTGGTDKLSPGDYGPHYLYYKSGVGPYRFNLPDFP